jgi:MarR family transcriptional regulator, transcriptional regulator for hemolysin
MSVRQIYDRISAIVGLLRAQDQVMLRPYGLTPAAFTVLSLLDATEGLRQVDLATRLLIDTSTMTRLIDRLERAGLAARIADPTDRRALRVVITSTGSAHVRLANHSVETLIAQRLSALSDAEQQQLSALLEKLRLSLSAELYVDPEPVQGMPGPVRGEVLTQE